MRLRGAKRRTSATDSGVREGSTEFSFHAVFHRGDKVEVRSDDDGFRGVWYEAVVLRRLPTRHRYLVSYATLLSEEDPTKPLREVINRSHIRPLPPPPPPLVEGYRIHSRVEAFHKDGWWAGVVSGVLLPGWYAVCFPTSREEIEFGHSELRPLLHWVSARRGWIPPEEMDIVEPTFKVGDIVEVSNDKDNHGPAWFYATIVKSFDDSTFLVEYNNVKSGRNGELLKEILDIQYMRAGPPLASYVKDFASGDEVEVRLDHGWLPGTVLETLGNAMYAVKLKHCEKTLEFDSNDMRYQRFWTGLNWVYKNKMVQKLLDPDGVESPKTNKKRSKRCCLPTSVSSDERTVAYELNADTSLLKWRKTDSSSKRFESEGITAVSKSAKMSSSEYNARSELGDDIEFGRGSAIPSGLEIKNYTFVPVVEDGFSIEEQCHIDNEPPQNCAVSSQDVSLHEAEAPEVNDSLDHVKHCGFLPTAMWTNSICSHTSKETVTMRRKKLVTRPSKRRKIALDVSLRGHTQNQIIDEIGDRLPDKCISRMSKSVRCSKETVTMRRKKLAARPPKRRKIALDVSLIGHAQNQIIDKIGNRLSDKCVSDMRKSVRCELENPEKSLIIIMGSEDSRGKDYLNQGMMRELPASDQTNASTAGRQVYQMRGACLTPHGSILSSSVLMNSFTCKPLSDVRRCSFQSTIIKTSEFCDSPGNEIVTAENQIFASPCEDISDVQEDPTRTRSPQVDSFKNERAVLVPQLSALPLKKNQIIASPCEDICDVQEDPTRTRSPQVDNFENERAVLDIGDAQEDPTQTRSPQVDSFENERAVLDPQLSALPLKKNQIIASPCEDINDVQEDPTRTRSPQVDNFENERAELDPLLSALPPKRNPIIASPCKDIGDAQEDPTQTRSPQMDSFENERAVIDPQLSALPLKKNKIIASPCEDISDVQEDPTRTRSPQVDNFENERAVLDPLLSALPPKRNHIIASPCKDISDAQEDPTRIRSPQVDSFENERAVLDPQLSALSLKKIQIIASPCEDISDVQGDPTRTRSQQVDSFENERAVLDPQLSALPPKKVLLPFVKNSVMWQSIESMDAFSKIPQEPHFRSLEQHSADFREGMAIGLMISFANLVSSIEKMTINEAPLAIEERLRDLEALKANGFNITCIRMRLEELLQIQVSWTESKSRKTMLEAHMSDMMDDCSRLNGLIISYDEAIRDLEGNIARIREKKDTIMRTNEINESVLVNIEREAHEAEEASRSIEERFITKLAAPW